MNDKLSLYVRKLWREDQEFQFFLFSTFIFINPITYFLLIRAIC